jgi:hypothetical protein
MEFCYRAKGSADSFALKIGNIHNTPVPAGDYIGKIALVDISYSLDFYSLERFPYQGELRYPYRNIRFSLKDTVKRTCPGIIFPQGQVRPFCSKKCWSSATQRRAVDSNGEYATVI